MGKLIDTDELKTKLMFDKRTANFRLRAMRMIFSIIDEITFTYEMADTSVQSAEDSKNMEEK